MWIFIIKAIESISLSRNSEICLIIYVNNKWCKGFDKYPESDIKFFFVYLSNVWKLIIWCFMQNPYVFNIFLNNFHTIIKAIYIFKILNKGNIATSRRMIRFNNPNIWKSIFIISIHLLKTFLMISN